MASKIVSFVAKAHGASLLGVHGLPESDLPYESLGVVRQPYDLNEPAAAIQLKTALVALGTYWSDRLAKPDPAKETRWTKIDVSTPYWEPEAADELAFAIGRLRGLGWQVPPPYAVETAVGPQPTATGLELIAGAVNDLLGGVPKMTHYESWRGGWVAPPSLISGPSATDPVAPNYTYGPGFKLPPYEVEGGVASGLQLVREALTKAWVDAMTPDKDESYRLDVEARIIDMRAQRNQLVEIAIAGTTPREGNTVVEHVEPEACSKSGGIWDPADLTCTVKAKEPVAERSYAPWILLGLGAAGVGYALWKSSQRPVSPSRSRRHV